MHFVPSNHSQRLRYAFICRNTAYQTLVRPKLEYCLEPPNSREDPQAGVHPEQGSPLCNTQIWPHHERNRAENILELANPRVPAKLPRLSDVVQNTPRADTYQFSWLCLMETETPTPRPPAGLQTYLSKGGSVSAFFLCPNDSTLERSACLCSNCHKPPSLPETGHVQHVWPGHTIDTPTMSCF